MLTDAAASGELALVLPSGALTAGAVTSQAAAKKHAAGYWKAWWAKFQSMSYGQRNAVYRKVRGTTCTSGGTANGAGSDARGRSASRLLLLAAGSTAGPAGIAAAASSSASQAVIRRRLLS